MKIYSESVLLNGADEPTKRMVDLWHQLCHDVLDADLEVGVANRREFEPTKTFKGELNTALPMSIDGNPMLVLLFDNTDSVEEVITTHELGHWILKLQGFKEIQKRNQPHSSEEILFNSLSQHPALYVLQRSVGHDPQDEIDNRARHNLSRIKPEPFALYRRQPVSPASESAERVLLFADDVLNCSPDISEAQLAKLEDSFPRDAKCIRDICNIRESFDPVQLESYPEFVETVRRRLG